MANFNYELFELIDRARQTGASISLAMDVGALMKEGRDIIETVQVHHGVPGVGNNAMSALAAAEALREAFASGRLVEPVKQPLGPNATRVEIDQRLGSGLLDVYDIIRSAQAKNAVQTVQSKASLFDQISGVVGQMMLPYLIEKQAQAMKALPQMDDVPADEQVLVEFFKDRIENEWDEADIPVRMARFGLMDPIDFSLEMSERMAAAHQPSADSLRPI